MHPPRSLSHALWLFPALLVSSGARASVLAPLDLPSLVAHADRVVVGTVESEVSRWNAAHNAIYSDITVRVGRALKGDAQGGDLVTVRREGGEVDGVGMRISGAAHFAAGEEVLLFLERRGAAYWTVGMAQGKMHVAVVGGRRLVYRNTAGIEFLSAPAPEAAVRPLDDLAGEIEAEVRRAGARSGARK